MAIYAKVYTDILRDPKLMRAARQGAKRLYLLPWLIVFAKDAQDGGRLTIGKSAAEPVDIAEMIPGIRPSDIRQCEEEALAIGVLVEDPDGALRFARWERRQSKPSDQPDEVRARVHNHRHRNAPGNAPGNAVNSGPGNTPPFTRAGNQDQEKDQDQQPPLPPLRGADAPPGVTVEARARPSNGGGTHLTLHRHAGKPPAASRSLPAVLTGLQSFLTEVSQQSQHEFEREQLRDVMVDLTFAYWAKRTRHDSAKLDRKRYLTIRKRLTEGDDNVHQVLFAVDGALKDDNLMGRKADSSRKYDGVSTIYRDWEQVERLATLGGYQEGRTHPMAIKYLDGAIATGAS